ncbi:hypothetical protein AURDEDRAFT_172664 [Auricularia subglabra TFB-10046 SS5]|nr:hypothetical protein AURDEDRAFT_172664 [Auricularia subglabra TFB-10046 SS5]
MTPFEVWYGRKPDVSHLRAFGSLAYTVVPADLRESFDSHYAKAICLGYSETKPGCWRFDNAEKRMHFESSQATELHVEDIPGVADSGADEPYQRCEALCVKQLNDSRLG